ncbi:DHA2 family efflux MFS transporter permease subunit [Sphingomonas sp.]|jgi:DHA2 family multidrug resistance protein|uniref:DHA2 family efflux MFS transporter permease subunit n=1 Tax=Sphingomonas sp. TaxID=28214 RepID=UPI002E15C870|nr:DHA2 family efflux MFS transporter permease subunit [Sphingomonas sp.]HEV7287629.1 DHA2 family efflux MFS transporter permease subunit [Sphingomonas sp.]
MASAPASSSDDFRPLTGAKLIMAAMAIAAANFLVVLDTTIANVSIPHIAGSLGVSSSEGTWVITSYAVAEAITVPLTGWLSGRFGAQRVFITCYLAFGALSLLCGLSASLGMLIGMRILLGLFGGLIMPLSQLLLLRIFPREKATLATVIWAMTTLIAPVAGPILGGVICDTWSWHWIFLINVPLAIVGGLATMFFLRGRRDTVEKVRIDKVGLGLLIVWVASLQIVLDEGRNHDWFASPMVFWMAVTAAIGFVAFLIWELTEENPIINLRVFRHRGFAVAAATYAAGFAAFSAVIVILPLWLQQNMGYTATWAGMATGIMGILAIVSAPLVGKATEKFDPRLVIFVGIMGLGAANLWRTTFTAEVTFLQMAWPTLLTGPFMVMFFVPITGLAISTVEPHEQATASGISNFMRTMAGAFATSIVQTIWSDATRSNQSEIVGAMTNGSDAIDTFVAAGQSAQGAAASLARIVESQSVMLATLDVFWVVAACFGFAAALIWLAPRPKGPIDTSAGH